MGGHRWHSAHDSMRECSRMDRPAKVTLFMVDL